VAQCADRDALALLEETDDQVQRRDLRVSTSGGFVGGQTQDGLDARRWAALGAGGERVVSAGRPAR
jgi:hypothetical protein